MTLSSTSPSTLGAAVGPALAAGLIVADDSIQSALLLNDSSFGAMGWNLGAPARASPTASPNRDTLRERVGARTRRHRGRVTLRRPSAVARQAGSFCLPPSGDLSRGHLRQGDAGRGADPQTGPRLQAGE